MAENVSHYILRRLHEEHGVRRIYGYPGDGINGLLGAFHEWGEKIEFVQTRQVPPLPPHISFDQARKLGEALAKGDPGRAEIVKESVKALLKR
jgi:pyruvate dehydrogenase (quinone)